MNKLKTGLLSFGAGVVATAVAAHYVTKPTGDMHRDFSNAVGQAYVADPNRDNLLVVNGLSSAQGQPLSYGLVASKGAVSNAMLRIVDNKGNVVEHTLVGEEPPAEHIALGPK